MLLPAHSPQFLLGLLQSSDQQKPTPESTSLPTAPPPAGNSMENKAGGQSWGKAAGPGPGEVEFRPRQPQLLPAAAMGPRLPHEQHRNAMRAPRRGPGWGLQARPAGREIQGQGDTEHLGLEGIVSWAALGPPCPDQEREAAPVTPSPALLPAV